MIKSQKGFTIIELMIATSVMSVMLVIISILMTNIGSLYSKAISQSHVQNDIRNITDDLAIHIKFSGTDVKRATSPDGKTKRLCFGTTRYTYIEGVRIGTDATDSQHVLWRDLIPSAKTCADPTNGWLNTADPSSVLNDGKEGTEMVSPRTRVTKLTITGDTSPYFIDLRLAVGEDDQLFVNGSGDTLCIGNQSGHQYCATADLKTTVIRRL